MLKRNPFSLPSGLLGRTALVLGGLLGTAILSLTILLAIPGARQDLLDAICATVSGPTFRLELQGLDLGQTWRLQHLAVHDANGIWLEVKELRVTPRLFALLSGQILLDEVGVEHLNLERLPVSSESTGSAGLPSLPPIAIRALHAPALHLGQPVLGQQADLGLEGELAARTGTLHGRLHLTRLDRDDSVDLQTTFQPHTRSLEVTLNINEKPGGLLHQLLNAQGGEGISLHLTGSGSLDSWPVSLHAQVADLGSGSLNATLSVPGDVEAMDLNATALLRSGPALAARTGLSVPDTRLQLAVHRTGDTLEVRTCTITNTLAQLDANGTCDLEQRTAQVRLTAISGNLAELLPPSVQAGPTRVAADITLADSTLNLRAQSALRNWSLSGLAVPAADLNATLEVPASFSSWQARGQLATRLPDLPDGLNDCTAQILASGSDSHVVLERVLLQAPNLNLRIAGDIADTMRMHTDFDLRNQRISAQGAPVSLTGTATIEGEPADTVYAATVDLNLTRHAGLPAPLPALLGQHAQVRSALELQGDLLKVGSMKLQGHTSGTGHGQIDLNDGTYTAAMMLLFPDLDFGLVRLARGSSLQADILGQKGTAQLTAQITAPALATSGLTLHDLHAQTQMRRQETGLNATVECSAQTVAGPLQLDLAAQMKEKTAHVSTAVLSLPGSRLTAAADMQLDSGAITARASLAADDLGPCGRLAGLTVHGKASGTAVLDAEQGLRADLDARDLNMADLRIAALKLAATSAPGSTGALSAEFDAHGLVWNETEGGRLTGTLSGTPDDILISVHAEHIHHDIRLQGRTLLGNRATSLTVGAVDGHIADQQLHLDQPLTITSDTNGLVWSALSLHVGRARLTSSGSLHKDGIISDSSLTGFDPSLFRDLDDDLPRTDISGSAIIRGTMAVPDVHLTVQADSLHVSETELEALPVLSAGADLRWNDGAVTSRLSLSSQTGTINATASLDFPLGGSLFEPVPDQTAPLHGTMHMTTDLAIIPHLLRLDDQIMSGRGSADLRIAGTFPSPRLSGTGAITAARYENFRTGTRLENLRGVLTARDARLDLSFNATDGASGTVFGTGHVDVENRAYEQRIHCDSFRVIGLDLVTSAASGDLQVRGTPAGIRVDGNLIVDPTRVRLPNAMPAGVSRIDVAEINTGKPRQTVATRPDNAPSLNIRVKVPARLFVTGRGLDSEWRGQIHVTGTTAKPKLVGQMQIVRGKFEFLDRTFDLTRGVLTLDGASPPNPYLDITGETSIQDITAQVQILGPARDFRLTLFSSPALPQDELLAMILFGRSMRQISPVQAIQLAQAAATLTGVGGGSGLDVFDKLKSRLGLREVEVGKDDDDNTSIGIGGYVGGKYYVRTQRTVSGEDRTKVEIQLTPQISVETEVGADSKNGGGVVWKHDY